MGNNSSSTREMTDADEEAVLGLDVSARAVADRIKALVRHHALLSVIVLRIKSQARRLASSLGSGGQGRCRRHVRRGHLGVRRHPW